jgi:hypothetical protein
VTSRHRGRRARGRATYRSGCGWSRRKIPRARRSRRAHSRSPGSHEVTADLVPRSSRGSTGATHDLAIDNRGNVPLNAVLSASTPIVSWISSSSRPPSSGTRAPPSSRSVRSSRSEPSGAVPRSRGRSRSRSGSPMQSRSPSTGHSCRRRSCRRNASGARHGPRPDRCRGRRLDRARQAPQSNRPPAIRPTKCSRPSDHAPTIGGAPSGGVSVGQPVDLRRAERLAQRQRPTDVSADHADERRRCDPDRRAGSSPEIQPGNPPPG